LFAVCVIVHVLTFVPSIQISMGTTGLLHLAAMAAFGAMIFSMNAVQRRRKVAGESGFFGQWRDSQRASKESFAEMQALVPRGIYYAGIALSVYVAINFIVFMGQMDEGSPNVQAGKFYLTNHGKVVREITESEFHRFEAYEVRGFSGHWMLFSMVPAVYFLFVEERLREKHRREAEQGRR